MSKVFQFMTRATFTLPKIFVCYSLHWDHEMSYWLLDQSSDYYSTVYSTLTVIFRGQTVSGLELFPSLYSPGEKYGYIFSTNLSLNVCIVVESSALIKTTFPLSKSSFTVILPGFCFSTSLTRGEVWAQKVSPLHRPITQKPSAGLRKTAFFLLMDSAAAPMYQSWPWPTSTVQLCFPDVKPVAPSTHTRLVHRSGLSGSNRFLQYCTRVNSSENSRLDWAVFGSRTKGTERRCEMSRCEHTMVNLVLFISSTHLSTHHISHV